MMRCVKNTDKCLAVGAFLSGAAVGMITALLIAPKEGQKTRKDIVDNLTNARDKVNDKLTQSINSAKAKISNALSTTKTVAMATKKAAKEAKNNINNDNYDDQQTEDEQEE